MEHHWEIVNAGMKEISDTPQSLWERAIKYFHWMDTHPVRYKKTITSGKEAGNKVEVEAPRPYNLKSLCLHCGIDERYIADIRATKEQDSEFYIVVSKIMYIIYAHNYEYAITGVYNPIFTAKAMGLEKEELPAVPVKVEIIAGLPELHKSESDLLEKLELERPDLLNPD